MAPEPLAVLILGPTGSGKTSLSLALGEHFHGEIVSCDSIAVYRGLDVGSAKPTVDERARVPHHLIDIANPDETFTAGEYSRQARTALQQIAQRGNLPIVSGGTGLYLRALTLGLFAGPARQQETRARLIRCVQAKSAHWLHRMLTKLDPPSAARIHPNDTPKLVRALEVYLATGHPLSETLAAGTGSGRDPLTGFRLLRIGLSPPRQLLYERLNQRAVSMFGTGLIDETRQLLKRHGKVTPLDSLGYRQAAAIVDGSMTLAEAIAAAQQGHRNYAKRQLTWFRKEPEVNWLEDFGDNPETIQRAKQLVDFAR